MDNFWRVPTAKQDKNIHNISTYVRKYISRYSPNVRPTSVFYRNT